MDEDDLQAIHDRHIKTATGAIAPLRKSIATPPADVRAALTDGREYLRGLYRSDAAWLC